MNTTLLRNIRLSKNITQDEMARSLGYADKSGYWHLENGKVNAKAETMLAIKRVLKLSKKQFQDIFFKQ